MSKAQTPLEEEFLDISISTYNEHPDYFNVRTYIHFLQTTPNWISAADGTTQANNMLNYLNAEFNKHRINFVNGANNSCQFTGASFFTLPGTDQSDYNFYQSFIANFPGPKGLHVFVLSNTQGIGGINTSLGWAFSAPSNIVLLSGQENGNPIALSPVLIHEVGHCFGLMHPDRKQKNGNDCPPPNEINCTPLPSPKCCNDMVDDTPTVNNLVCGVDAFAANYMVSANLWACRDNFTPIQVLRMREYLKSYTVTPLLQEVQVLPTLGTVQSVSGSIIVETGTELIISQDMEMLPDAYIYVKKGAVLKVAAKISGACGKMWRGIIIEGSTQNLSQSLASQGKVELMPRAIIEHAITGVEVQDPSDITTAGGILNAYGAIFRNNTIGVKFGAFTRSGVINGQLVNLPNKSYFSGCTFTVDANYRGNTLPAIKHLDILGVGGLAVRYCTFNDDRAVCIRTATGIASRNSGLNLTYSRFLNLNRGVDSDKLTEEAGGISILINDFINCRTGVNATTSASNLFIRSNDFEMGRDTQCTGNHPDMVGVVLSAALTGLQLRENSFTNTTPSVNINKTGTICNSIGANYNSVEKNYFSDLSISNLAQGENANFFNGLVYLCNESTVDSSSTIADYQFTGTVRKDQGTLIPPFNVDYAPAGNLFSQKLFTIKNDAPEKINYYFYKFDLLQIPVDSPNVLAVNINQVAKEFANNSCEVSPTDPCPPPCNELVVNQYKSDFFAFKNQWQAAQNAFILATDPVIREQRNLEVTRYRQLMDLESNKILRIYTGDTTQTNVDSILQWYYLAESKETWMYIARHHFFKQNYAAFNAIWNRIDTHFSLSGEELNWYNRLDSFFNILYQPVIVENTLDQLPTTVRLELQALMTDCDEAAFLSKVVLNRNGVDVDVNCASQDSVLLRFATFEDATRSNLCRIMPNPTRGNISVQFAYPVFITDLQVIDMLGRTRLSQKVYQEIKTVYPLQLPALEPGRYQFLAHSNTGLITSTFIVQ